MAFPPHVDALDPKYEWEPKIKVPRHLTPLNGVMFKVESGENFESYAAFAGMDVWKLIQYNFRTNVPQEVNWYLRNYTGCKKTTPDGKNFSFSDNADPGIIFFPRWNYEQLIKNRGKPPPPIVEDYEYMVPGYVPGFIQKGLTCWSGAFGMIVAWKKPGFKTVLDVLNSTGDPQWAQKREDGVGIFDHETAQLAKLLGLRGEHRVPADPQEWHNALRAYGVLVVVQSSIPGWVHWIVVTGIKMEYPSTINLVHIDPRSGREAPIGPWTVTREAEAAHWSYSRWFHF